jgi:hypothetical protein
VGPRGPAGEIDIEVGDTLQARLSALDLSRVQEVEIVIAGRALRVLVLE